MEDLRISKIRELELNKDHVEKFVLFDSKVDYQDIALMYNEFGFDKSKIEGGMKNYRDLAIIFRLSKQDPELLDAWDDYIIEVMPMPREITRLDNILINHDFNKVLLITNKRLMKHDLSRLNKKINEINTKIAIHNAPMTRKPTIRDKLVKLFKQ